MTFTQEFPSSVIEKLNYYVYLLLEPETGQVFYVGKGKGNRVFAHINAALKDETPSDKLDKIRAIRTSGREVNHIVHRHGLTEKEAFEVEAALIDFIGLSGLTNQVQGYNSDDRGKMTVAEVVSKYQAPIAEIVEPVVLITVNRLYQYGMSAERLYEITRGKWVIGTRRNEAKYAFAVFRGIIREVYEIERWLPAPIAGNSTTGKVKQKNRWEFEGKTSESLQHYVGASTENYQVLGAQNPIRYVNCRKAAATNIPIGDNLIEKAFADHFKPWSLVLPEGATAEEEPGVVVGQGWHIRYIFGSDEQGKYLDFLGSHSHRMTNERHIRLRASGKVEGLPAIQEGYVWNGTEEDQQRAEAEYLAYNRQIGEMLREKGLMD